jgi:hypothetical protein
MPIDDAGVAASVLSASIWLDGEAEAGLVAGDNGGVIDRI